MTDDDIECESFTVISIDSLLVYVNKYYLQVYLDNYAYKIVENRKNFETDEDIMMMLYYNRIDIYRGTDVAKSNSNKECMNCHYCFFNHGFKFQDSVSNDCYDLTTFCLNMSDISLIRCWLLLYYSWQLWSWVPKEWKQEHQFWKSSPFSLWKLNSTKKNRNQKYFNR